MTIPARLHIFLKFAIALLSVSSALLSLELILRIFGPEYYKFNNQSAVYYTNPRNYHIPVGKDGNDVLYGLNYTVDANGYRLPDGATAEPDHGGGSSILGLGDSFTFGRGVKYDDIYLTVLQKAITGSGHNVKIKNCGVIGYNLPEVFRTYLEESSRKKYPLVIYGFVLNDFGLPVRIYGDDQIDLNNGGYAFDPRRENSALYNFVRYLVDRKRLSDITTRAYLDAFRGKNAGNNFAILRAMHGDIKAKKGKLVIILFPLLYNFGNYPFREIHEKLAAFCGKEGIPLIDLLPAFSKYKAEDLWVNPTDHHPNEIANKIAAGVIYYFLIRNGLLPPADKGGRLAPPTGRKR
jgi:hypothetical protein